jgi:hypothetical protein
MIVKMSSEKFRIQLNPLYPNFDMLQNKSRVMVITANVKFVVVLIKVIKFPNTYGPKMNFSTL